MLAFQRSLFPPLEGTVPLPHGVFVDRWGTLLETPAAGFARHPDELRFLPGSLEALFRASRSGWRIYLIGNEDPVARGRLAEADWKSVEAALLARIAAAGIPLARNYACIDHPQGIAGRRNDSVFLLPNTGAFYHAAHTDGLELAKSWVIGDSTLELVAGWRAGCRLAAVRTGEALRDREFEVEAEIWEKDLGAVVVELLERTEALR
jgi:D-glycero-D-manno-heptose 1,7-bisphosphate phosphatase